MPFILVFAAMAGSAASRAFLIGKDGIPITASPGKGDAGLECGNFNNHDTDFIAGPQLEPR